MNRLISSTVFAALLTVAHGASASIIWDFGTEFSGSGSSLSGIVQVTVDDGGGTGSVSVTVDATNLDGSLTEYISGLYLNLDSAIDPAALTEGFSNPPPGSGPPEVSGISLGADAFKADGDGFFDIQIDWVNQTFNAGETDSVTFALPGLQEEDFDFLSTPASGGGSGPFVAALRARSLDDNGDGSGWFYPETDGGEPPGQIPEPGILALFGIGLMAVGATGIRRRRSATRQ